MEFSERLLMLRKERGLSQEELAEYLEVTRQAVSRWESGATLPDAPNLIRLAELFGVSIDWLLRGGEKRSEAVEKPHPLQREPVEEAAEKPVSKRKIPHLLCGFLWLVAAGSMVAAGALSSEIYYVGLALVDAVIACVHFWFHFYGSQRQQTLSWHGMEKESRQHLTSALLFLFASVCFFLAGAIGGNLLFALAGLMNLIASLGFFCRWHKSVSRDEI